MCDTDLFSALQTSISFIMHLEERANDEESLAWEKTERKVEWERGGRKGGKP